ncbi:MAG TPA: NADH-quinone oxidoreductase subunit L, partial [Armatimonadota bacterium]|nr:NADH-quinone oxidoreductase subunit L [Armatimonadota bacterium]
MFERLSWLIPVLPLIAAAVLIGWGKKWHERFGDRVALIGVVGIAIPCVIAWGVLYSRVTQTADFYKAHPEVLHGSGHGAEGAEGGHAAADESGDSHGDDADHGAETASAGHEEPAGEQQKGPAAYEQLVEWQVFGHIAKHIPTKGDFDGKLRVGIRIDNLTAAMLAMVTLIATLIQIYSMGYMHGDPRYSRFFAYLSLFCFSMLLLVLSSSFLLLFAGWELVGLCSYLLIGFWYEKPSAADAAKKAFIVNRIGDFGFLVGIMIVFYYCPSLDIAEALGMVGDASAFPILAAAIAGACLFAGAIGKSAQFPLHVWLPDAMEGPTPVSALIHAATMVAAGVYMVARIAVIYTNEHVLQIGCPILGGMTSIELVRYVGIITAVMAGTIGIAQNDIKRVLAYSTVSQLGFMIFGIACFGWVAGVFHLLTHAFFKALLFLGSGSVIHGCGGEQDMWKMGGLRKSMPVTFWTFLMGTLALTGVPLFFSGFWSKDEIMVAAFTFDKPVFWLGEFAAFCTALYMGRLMFLTFAGDRPRDESIHPHESPKSMTIPLIVLAIFAVGLGWLGIPPAGGGHSLFHTFVFSVEPSLPEAAKAISHFSFLGAKFATIPLLVSVLAAGLGWLFAALIWGWKVVDPVKLKASVPGLAMVHTTLRNKYYFDEIYNATFVRGLMAFANACGTFDKYVVDGIVNGTGWFF